MDYFTYKRTLIITVIVLVVLNLGTVFTIWVLWKPSQEQLIPEPPPLPPPPPPINVLSVMSSELNLTREQRIFFRNASERFKKRSEQVLRVYHADKKQLMDELAKESPDTLLLNRLTISLGNKQTELERVMVGYFMELREVCTPEQRRKFKFIIDQVIQRMSLSEKKQKRIVNYP